MPDTKLELEKQALDLIVEGRDLLRKAGYQTGDWAFDDLNETISDIRSHITANEPNKVEKSAPPKQEITV